MITLKITRNGRSFFLVIRARIQDSSYGVNQVAARGRFYITVIQGKPSAAAVKPGFRIFYITKSNKGPDHFGTRRRGKRSSNGVALFAMHSLLVNLPFLKILVPESPLHRPLQPAGQGRPPPRNGSLRWPSGPVPGFRVAD